MVEIDEVHFPVPVDHLFHLLLSKQTKIAVIFIPNLMMHNFIITDIIHVYWMKHIRTKKFR